MQNFTNLSIKIIKSGHYLLNCALCTLLAVCIACRTVQRALGPVQGRRLSDAQADGRVRGLAAPHGLRVAPHRAHRRAGQVHGAQQDGPLQAQLLPVLMSDDDDAICRSHEKKKNQGNL